MGYQIWDILDIVGACEYLDNYMALQACTIFVLSHISNAEK